MVQPAERTDDVADVGSDTKVRDATNVDGNVHWRDLTIECATDAGEIGTAVSCLKFRVSGFG